MKVARLRAIYAYEGTEEHTLSLAVGDVVEVVVQGEPGKWWTGHLADASERVGVFPANYCEVIAEYRSRRVKMKKSDSEAILQIKARLFGSRQIHGEDDASTSVGSAAAGVQDEQEMGVQACDLHVEAKDEDEVKGAVVQDQDEG